MSIENSQSVKTSLWECESENHAHTLHTSTLKSTLWGECCCEHYSLDSEETGVSGWYDTIVTKAHYMSSPSENELFFAPPATRRSQTNARRRPIINYCATSRLLNNRNQLQ